MSRTVLEIPENEKRQLQVLARSTRDAIVHLRCRLLLALPCCCAISRACMAACAARSTAYAARRRYLEGGLAAITVVAGGRPRRKVTDGVRSRLKELIEQDPRQYGWARSHW